MKSVSLVSLNIMEISKVGYRINVKHSYRRQLHLLWALVILLSVALGGFIWLAIRNARPLNCSSYGTDLWGNNVCQIRVDGVNNLDYTKAVNSGGLDEHSN